MTDEEPKIIVDEGWKAQVQREREEAAAKAQQQTADPSQAASETPDEGLMHGYPEPSFTAVVTNLAAQAMMALGGMPGPNEDEVLIDLNQAQFCIEGLAILREKTKGNLTEAESKHLDDVIRQLAQAFTMMVREFEAQAMHDAGLAPPSLGQ